MKMAICDELDSGGVKAKCQFVPLYKQANNTLVLGRQRAQRKLECFRDLENQDGPAFQKPRLGYSIQSGVFGPKA